MKARHVPVLVSMTAASLWNKRPAVARSIGSMSSARMMRLWKRTTQTASGAPLPTVTARAVGRALAEVEATGLGRAMLTGVKAIGRAMEERGGGGVDPPPSPKTITRAYSPEVTADAERLGLPPSKVQDVLDTPKPNRPSPDD